MSDMGMDHYMASRDSRATRSNADGGGGQAADQVPAGQAGNGGLQ